MLYIFSILMPTLRCMAMAHPLQIEANRGFHGKTLTSFDINIADLLPCLITGYNQAVDPHHCWDFQLKTNRHLRRVPRSPRGARHPEPMLHDMEMAKRITTPTIIIIISI